MTLVRHTERVQAKPKKLQERASHFEHACSARHTHASLEKNHGSVYGYVGLDQIESYESARVCFIHTSKRAFVR